MIPVFIFSIVASFFGNIRGGNLIYKACRIWGDVWCAVIFIRHKNIYEQPLRKGESYIFVANHISYFDAPIIVKTFRKTDFNICTLFARLPGLLRSTVTIAFR